MKKFMMGIVLAGLSMGTIACGDADDIQKAIDTATDIAGDVANCKKPEICKQSEAFSDSIKGADSCELKATKGTEYIANNSDAMKDSVTKYSGVTEWSKVDDAVCSTVTIKKIADCSKAMKDTYDSIASCESSMTEEQKHTFDSLENFNNELEKVANESSKAAQGSESSESK